MTERIIRKPELLKMVGVSYMTIYRMEKKGRFPQKIAVSERSVGWRESEVLAWMANAN